ncbi:MAG: CrcB family protein [Solirubrobacterales bacterium]|nr:CrcB family protein [Solirubrobacterales bacterium]
MSPLGWVAVGLAGGLAAGARYLLDREITRRQEAAFPTGILVVNLLGTFVLGLVAGSTLDGEALVIVAGGAIGSFTTFSTLILDSHLLVRANLAGFAWLNIALSMVAGFVAIALGHTITS